MFFTGVKLFVFVKIYVSLCIEGGFLLRLFQTRLHRIERCSYSRIISTKVLSFRRKERYEFLLRMQKPPVSILGLGTNCLLLVISPLWTGKLFITTTGTVAFPRVKGTGRGADHPPPSRAEVEERLELYLYSPSGPSWPFLR